MPSLIPAHRRMGVIVPLLSASLAWGGEVGSGGDALWHDALAGHATAIATCRLRAASLDVPAARAVLGRLRQAGRPDLDALTAAFLAHADPYIRQEALLVLGRTGFADPATLDRILQMLDDAAPMVWRTAGETLGRLRDPRSWPALIAMLDGPDAVRTGIAADSLRQQTAQTFPADRAAWDRWYRDRLARDEADLERFRQALARPDAASRLTAIEGLAGLGLVRDRAGGLLVPLVHDADPVVSARAAGYLRQWTGSRGDEPMIRCLERARTWVVEPATPVLADAAPRPASARTAMAPKARGFLDTGLGLVSLLVLLTGVLGVTIWSLRPQAPEGKSRVHRRAVRP